VTFPTSGVTAPVNWRLYPDVTNWPLRWWNTVGNAATYVDLATGVDISAIAIAGDAYLLTKPYGKRAFYTTESEVADWGTTKVLLFGDEDGGLIQRCVSWKGRLLVVCSDGAWRVTGYGPETPWEKEHLTTSRGTFAPQSVVTYGDETYWMSPSGVVGYSGGYGLPALISDRIASLVGDYEPTVRENFCAVEHLGNIYFSYATRGSYVHNRTLTYRPETQRWEVRTFGMYAPAVIEEQNNKQLVFWEPTTGKICRAEYTVEGLPVYKHAGRPPDWTWETAFCTPTGPVETAQWLYAKAIIKSDSPTTVAVDYSVDYNPGTYFTAGTMTPIDYEQTGRRDVSSQDRLYLCRFPVEARGASISVRLRGTAQDALDIMNLELLADGVESETLK
jgi:hypothetical protein